MPRSLVVAALASVSLAAYGGDGPPELVRVYTVAPDVLALRVSQGKIIRATQRPYVKQPGDQVKSGSKHQRSVIRNGKELGHLVGPNDAMLYNYDRVVGHKLDTVWAAKPENYTISSWDDEWYVVGRKPTAVHRKSKPTAMARIGGWRFDFPMTHVLYLRLPRPLVVGKGYNIRFAQGLLKDASFSYDPATVRSEAVHVNHVGFRPDAPVKRAYLSCWLGDGGGVTYRVGTPFTVVEDHTGRVVHRGKVELSLAASGKEDAYKKNYNQVDVYRMDFAGVTRPGRYRVSVEGIGCSYPFEIKRDVWRDALRTALRGFYHQRSGVALGPPYTEYERPRCFHPDDGVKIYHSNCPLMDSGNGLNARGTDKGNFGNLVKGKTNRIVPDAWGGYFDAGDWDRRIQHLRATRLLLELYDLFPDAMRGLDLNIPESRNRLPDIVDEALFNLDCYRRMQTPEGGIRGGIESAEHPRHGECSWQEQLDIMAYAPGAWSSYVYAGDAARAARILRKLQSPLASTYERSALRAMEYAEDKYANHDYKKLPHAVPDARNLAAAELYRLTGDNRWHVVFVDTSVFKDPKNDLFVWKHHRQGDAAYVYAVTERETDDEIKTNARNAILREADGSVKIGRGTGFNWTKINTWIPVGWGCTGAPQATNVLRAYHLTKDRKYLECAVLATQLGSGANPANLCFTTGVGHDWPRNPLVVDMRNADLEAPPGITVFGPFDMERNKDYWTLKVLTKAIYPRHDTWPSLEAYFDVVLFPAMTEFTIDATLGPNTYVWGWLHARE